MIDPVKILGALLGGGGVSSGSGTDILKSVVNAAVSGKNGDGLEDLLGSVLGGSSSSSSQSGLEDILGGVLGGGGGKDQSGGLQDILGSVLGGGPGPKVNTSRSRNTARSREDVSDIGDILGGVLDGGDGTVQGGGSDLDVLIGAALKQFGLSEDTGNERNSSSTLMPRNFEDRNHGMSYNEASDQATLLIRAMINAAKADGRLDENEKANITGRLGTVTPDEVQFVNSELAKPLDVDAFSRSVPEKMANQVYAMSLTAIDLDSNPEAQYLHQLAQNLGINRDTVDQIHAQLGAPALYD